MTLIFLADDDPLIRSLVELRLSRNGYQVQSSGDGASALERLNGLSPDLIILDFNMPKMNGLAVARALSNNLRLAHVPIMMLTAAADANVVKVAAELKVAAYLLKPFTPDVLAERVRRLVSPVRAAEALAQSSFELDG